MVSGITPQTKASWKHSFPTAEVQIGDLQLYLVWPTEYCKIIKLNEKKILKL